MYCITPSMQHQKSGQWQSWPTFNAVFLCGGGKDSTKNSTVNYIMLIHWPWMSDHMHALLFSNAHNYNINTIINNIIMLLLSLL